MTVALGQVDGKMLVACSECGGCFYTSARTLRDQRVKERLPVCSFCRFPSDVVASPADRRFWVDHFTIGEIIEMAEAFWGDRDRWPARELWWTVEANWSLVA